MTDLYIFGIPTDRGHQHGSAAERARRFRRHLRPGDDQAHAHGHGRAQPRAHASARRDSHAHAHSPRLGPRLEAMRPHVRRRNGHGTFSLVFIPIYV